MIAAIGCGPSLRRVHRSNVYFERCYAADLDRRVPVEERRACWQAWATHWQEGQDPARIDYVRERLLRLDPERAALVALATGGSDADPVPLTETTPAIASEAQHVAEASSTSADEAVSATTETPIERAPEVAPSDGREAEPVGTPEPPPRAAPTARERRASRPAVMPIVEPAHCAAACRPSWLECTARCDEFDRFACERACRAQLRTCARACY
ncbi:Hypothetical protein I5071_27120 [Sandaracinus amylolyticus]|nr:Hypothetical protein I5071_27120 [Sandaracinus amylolyticus]